MTDVRKETIQSLTESAAVDATEIVIFVDVDLVDPDPNQPRTEFNEESLAELAASIKTHGLIHPIKIREHPTPGGLAEYMLVDGERRWRAAKLGKIPRIRALLEVDGLDKKAILDRQFAANVQHEGMTVRDQAKYLRDRLADPEVGTYEKLSAVCGLGVSRISRLLKAAEVDGIAGLAADTGLSTDPETIVGLANLEKTSPEAAAAVVKDAKDSGKKITRAKVKAATDAAKGGAGKAGEAVGKGKGKGDSPAPQGGVGGKAAAGSWDAPRSRGDDDQYRSVAMPNDGPGKRTGGTASAVKVGLSIAPDFADSDVVALFKKMAKNHGKARLCMVAGTDIEGHALVEFGDAGKTEAFPMEALRLAAVEYPA